MLTREPTLFATLLLRYRAAAHLTQEAVRRWEALGDPQGLGATLFSLGYAADVAGETASAAAAEATRARLQGAGPSVTSFVTRR